MKNNSLQINLPNWLYNQLESIKNRINKEDLHGKGFDVGTPHITVRYGINTTNVELIKTKCSMFFPFYIKLGRTSLFPPSPYSEGSSVLKIDVISPQLHLLNKHIDNYLPTIPSSFDNYIPHITVAYIKENLAQKYTSIDILDGTEFIASDMTLVHKDNTEKNIQMLL